MLTFKSNKYKKEDLIAFAVALEYQNDRFINCPDKQKNNCSSCWYYRCCTDMNKLYDHILEKIKSYES